MQIVHQGIDQLILTKGVRSANPQRADGIVTGPGQLIFQRMPRGQQLPRLGVAAFAIIGELQRMGRAQNELQPQPLLQDLQPPADGRLGGTELCRSGGEAAALNNTDKSLHQFDAVAATGMIHTLHA